MKRKFFPVRIHQIFILFICIFIFVSVSNVVGQNDLSDQKLLSANTKVSDSPYLKLPDEKKDWLPILPPKYKKKTVTNSSIKSQDVIEYDVITSSISRSSYLEPQSTTLPSLIPPNTDQFLGAFEENDRLEAVFPPDDRVKISPTVDFPWRTICKLYITFPDGNHFVGTGFLVGRNDRIGFHCLTAGHCVYRREYGGWAKTVEIIPALDNDYTPFYSAWATKIKANTGWTEQAMAEYDWACLTLDRSVASFTGWMDRFTTTDLNWYRRIFHCAGYPIDLDFGLCLYYDSDSGKVADEFFHWYSMDASEGQSGMPIWVMEGNTRRIVAIHIGDAEGSDSNRGVRFNAEKLNQLNQWVTEDPPPTDLPDLIDDGPKWSGFKPNSVVRGFHKFTVWNDIRNIGTANASPVYVSYYASLDENIEPDKDYLIGTKEVTKIPPFNWRHAERSEVFPEQIPPGQYYIGWIIDPDNRVTEFNESNNKAFISAQKLTVQDPYIEVTTPNGGEVLVIGEENLIQWVTAGGSGLVTIDISYDNGNSWQNLVTNILDSGRYLWRIPSSQKTALACLIRITDTFKNLTDLSNAPFIIETRPTVPGIPQDGRPWTSQPEVKFLWSSAADPETGISAYEVQIGTSPNSNDVADVWIGNELSYTAKGSHNQTLYARVRAKNGVGLVGPWSASSDGILIDLTPPILQGGPVDEGEFSAADSVLFKWNPAVDEESGIIMNYKLQVGSAIGLNDIFDQWINRRLQYKVAGKHGQTLYARIKVHNAAIGVSEWSEWSDGITIDTTPPSTPGKPYSEGLAVNCSDIPFFWEAATEDISGISDYHLKVIDVSAGSQVVFDSWIGNLPEHSARVTGEHFFIGMVQARNGAGVMGPWSQPSEPVKVYRNPIPLILIDYSPTYPGDDWLNAIDRDLEGWYGTVSAITYFDKKPYAIFGIAAEDTFHVDKIRLMTDTGVDWEGRWVTSFRLLYSLTGTNDNDFKELIKAQKHGGDWEEYTFPEQRVRYLKLVLDLPDLNTAEYAQLGEFEVYGNFETGKLELTPLQLLSGTRTWPGEDWTNAIDNDLSDWDGTVSANAFGLGGQKPQAIFNFPDSVTNVIAKVRLLTDTGVGWWAHWVKDFRIDISTTGTRDEDFITVFMGQKTTGGWESFYFQPVMAKYVKLVLLSANEPNESYYQIGEFEVYKKETIPQSYVRLNKNSDDLLSAPSQIDLPKNFSIAQNYPNPFNPETAISYQLPEQAKISLIIYNLMGQKIITLIDELKPAGYHTVVWDGCDSQGYKVPSGVYLYQFCAGEYNVTKKMIMME